MKITDNSITYMLGFETASMQNWKKATLVMSTVSALLTCSNHDRSNPIDPDGSNWNPQTISVMKDTVVSINDSFYVYADVVLHGVSITSYIWEFPNIWDSTQMRYFRDTTSEGRIKIAYPSPGNYSIGVWAMGENGFLSGWKKNEKYYPGDRLGQYYNIAEYITVNVHQYAPSVGGAMTNDTTTSINDSIEIRVYKATDTNGVVTKYLWAKTGTNYNDTTSDGAFKVAWPDSGKKTVLVKVVDDDGLVSKPETCVVQVTLNPPSVVVMNDTMVNINDSITITAAGQDNGCIAKYLWAKTGTVYSDTTISGAFKVAYSDSGRKTLLVKVIDDDGVVSKQDTCILNVQPNPPAVVGMHDTTVAIYDTSYIHAAGTDQNGTVMKYLWALDGINFKDSTDSGRVQASFSTAGLKTILVKVRDDDGLVSGEDNINVTVELFKPLAIVTQDTTVAINDSFYLHVTGTDQNGTIKKFIWALDEMNYKDTTDSGRIKVVFLSVGKKIILVKVLDDDGFTSSGTGINVTVHSYPPGIVAMADTTVAINDSFYIHAAAMDTNGTILKYYWYSTGIGFKDSTDSGRIKIASDSLGDRKIFVKVWDNDGNSGFDSMVVTINPYPPTVVAMNDTIVAVRDSFYMHAVGKDINGTIIKYYWYSAEKGLFDSTDRVKIAFDSVGEKKVFVWVKDDDGIVSLADTVNLIIRHNQPDNLFPSTGDTFVTVRPTLRWIPGLYINSFTVRLDTVNPPVTVVATGIKDTFFTPDLALINYKSYFWQVTGINGNGLEAPGAISQFVPGKWGALGSGMNGDVNALAFDTLGNLYAGGYFTTAGGVAVNNIARWNGNSWGSLGSGVTNGQVKAIALDAAGNLYAGGYFTNAGGISVNRIAKWNGRTWGTLGSGTNSEVTSLAVDSSGNLYAAGYFTTAGGIPANHIAKWNGSTWSALGSGVDSVVRSIAIDASGNLYAGGDFTMAGGISANRIAKWNGSTWSALGSGLDDDVWILCVDITGNLYAGGWFSTAGGLASNYFAKWNCSSWSAPGNGTCGSGHQLTCDTSGNIYLSCNSFNVTA